MHLWSSIDKWSMRNSNRSLGEIEMANDRFAEQNEVVYTNSRYIIAREWGQAPNGNPFKGQWVCRCRTTGDYIDHDAHRYDLFERHI